MCVCVWGGSLGTSGLGEQFVLDAKGDRSHRGSESICSLGQEFCPFGSRDLGGGTVCPQSSKTGAELIAPWLPTETQMPVGRGDIWPTELTLGHCPSCSRGQ